MTTTIEEVEDLRDEAMQILDDMPNVVGSMIGYKITNGKFTNIASLIVLVSEKMAKDKLSLTDCIPTKINVSGRNVATDLLVWHTTFFPHSFPTGKGLMVHAVNSHEHGTVSCFCKSKDGIYYGLTCAHVLSRAGSRVLIWDEEKNWQDVGTVDHVRCIEQNETGERCNLFDAGLFTLAANPTLKSQAQNAQSLQAVAPAPEPGDKLYAWGEGAGNPSGRKVTGRVCGFNAKIPGANLDIVILMDDPGASGGDSGMLWRKKENGQAVAIHIGGDKEEGSLMSGAMLVSRIVNHFNLELLAV